MNFVINFVFFDDEQCRRCHRACAFPLRRRAQASSGEGPPHGQRPGSDLLTCRTSHLTTMTAMRKIVLVCMMAVAAGDAVAPAPPVVQRSSSKSGAGGLKKVSALCAGVAGVVVGGLPACRRRLRRLLSGDPIDFEKPPEEPAAAQASGASEPTSAAADLARAKSQPSEEKVTRTRHTHPPTYDYCSHALCPSSLPLSASPVLFHGAPSLTAAPPCFPLALRFAIPAAPKVSRGGHG